MFAAIPWYVTPIVLAVNLFLLIFLSRVVAKASHAAGLDPGTARRVVLFTSLGLTAWFIAAWAVSLMRAPAPSPTSLGVPLSFPLFMGGAIAVSLVALARPAWRRTADAVPLSTLVGIQLFRVIGAMFLVLYAAGTLPARFALTAGWGDIAVGLTAPLVALALLRKMPGSRLLAAGFNILGLIDLVIAVGLGTGLLVRLLDPGSALAPATAMQVFPLAIIPTFAVPLAMVLHLYSLRAVLSKRPENGAGRREMGHPVGLPISPRV